MEIAVEQNADRIGNVTEQNMQHYIIHNNTQQTEQHNARNKTLFEFSVKHKVTVFKNVPIQDAAGRLSIQNLYKHN